jgi:DNA-directed RNA polymerase subunit M/transcription elongation factor TFIIS
MDSDGNVGPERPEPQSEPKPSAGPAQLHCTRCGADTTLVTVLRRFGDQPGYRLFRCVACENYDWNRVVWD